MFAWLRARRRARLMAQPVPASWDRIIDANVALARGLTPDQRRALSARVSAFIGATSWEGCGGLELTEEVQVTIAAQACLLTLGRADDLYTDVESILVYPSTLVRPPRPLGLFEQPTAPVGHGTAILGEAMLRGPVVLAWDAVQAGGRGERPGNVVLHEFAHKLDMATGHIDGTPPLARRADRTRWAEVCARVYALHRARVDAGWATAMDPYGATNEAEFFAVATETYFTRPAELAWEHPDLYQVLADFYRLELAPGLVAAA
ncbi:MAG: zinc-dependent peptidase [Kofleriaceae bacterium]